MADFVGKTWGKDVTESDVLAIFGGTTNLQVIPAGCAATMEMRAGRVRVWLGEGNKILRVTEG